jgi:hypothetical protein
MARKHGKKSGSVRSAAECARGVTVGFPRVRESVSELADSTLTGCGSAIVTLRADSASYADRRPFLHRCKLAGVRAYRLDYSRWRLVETAPGTLDAMRCCDPAVLNWETDCPTRVTTAAVGSGPEKAPPARPPKPKPRILGQCPAPVRTDWDGMTPAPFPLPFQPTYGVEE